MAMVRGKLKRVEVENKSGSINAQVKKRGTSEKEGHIQMVIPWGAQTHAEKDLSCFFLAALALLTCTSCIKYSLCLSTSLKYWYHMGFYVFVFVFVVIVIVVV